MSLFSVYIHPTAVIGEPPEHRDFHGSAIDYYEPQIAPGVKIEALVTVDSGMHEPTRLGAGTWLMKKVHIGHDAQIGENCEIAPLCSIGGHAIVGNDVRMGQGVTIKPFVTIGDGARLGMGAVVTRDVPAGEVWVGNPAEEISSAKARRDKLSDLTLWEEWWRERAAEVPAQ